MVRLLGVREVNITPRLLAAFTRAPSSNIKLKMKWYIMSAIYQGMMLCSLTSLPSVLV